MQMTVTQACVTKRNLALLTAYGLWLTAASCSYTPVAQVNAEKARVLREDGDAAVQAKDLAGAVSLYTASISANSEYAETWYRRGNVYAGMVSQPESERPSRELLELANGDFTEAIRLNPAHYEAHFNRAMIGLKYARYREAVKDLLQCAAIRTKDPEPHLLLAKLYEEKFEDRQVAAMEHCEKYVDLGGTDDGIREKVRQWRELKKSMVPANSGPAPKASTEADEKEAESLHARVIALIGEGKRKEAVTVLESLTAKYGHTRYVRDRSAQFAALRKAFGAAETPK